MNYAYELLVIIPGAVVYCSKFPVTFLGCVFFLIAFLLLPLLVVAASALFGWLIALANTKMRNKNVIMMVLTLILFMAYMYVCLRLQYYLQKLIENGSAIGEAIQKTLPPFYYLGKSITDGDVVAFLIFLAFCIVPFALVYYILSRSFIKIATTNRGHKKIVYKEKALKASSIRKALIIKESRHFLGSPMYMFNAGIGLLFMLIGAGYLFVKGGDMLKNSADVSWCRQSDRTVDLRRLWSYGLSDHYFSADDFHRGENTVDFSIPASQRKGCPFWQRLTFTS